MKKWLIILIAIVVVIGLPLAWYLVSPLFIDNVVDEGLPVSGADGENVAVESDGQVGSLESVVSGFFVDADSFHKVSGTATVLDEGGKKYLRFEDFESTNGPDLFVYLATDESAEDFVDLGRLKGNVGNQNYEIPADVDLSEHDEVLIWCKAFSVLFGSAELN